GPPRDAGFARLTPAEEETLRTAHEMGYYRVPRGPGVRDVAQRLGLSASAAGYRLRRAQGKLVAAYLE
ncbi:MAG TPA: helix-turn-helix domain-containing protein, partial [Candidatus Thermoplasmatota archaeon]|nr:helix-turn-helix domain-containing protein [Candidatus Thermoplasmatota archaeon]